jgi:hypothetical protein
MSVWKILAAINALTMMANLGFYAWGSHDPASLAIGIFNGVVFLMCHSEANNAS